jgi:type III restriction enzyme
MSDSSGSIYDQLGISGPEEVLRNPIINSPYEAPKAHAFIGKTGPTGQLVSGRRPSSSYAPTPPPRKEKEREEPTIDFEPTGGGVQRHDLINEIRKHVGDWRNTGYQGVTAVTKRLLTFWADPTRENRILFCQREAAETAIWLTEVSESAGQSAIRGRLAESNNEFNEGLPRIALKMATATGKTVVMGMLIAWQTINKVHSPRDNRFTKRFLIVTPGLTIRDRLRVLHPESDGNYYHERGLVPNDLWQSLLQVRIGIVNYHQFLPRATREADGVAAKTLKILRGGQADENPFLETESQVVTRVLRDIAGPNEKVGEIIVINDEAHHCYRERPDVEDADREDQDRNDEARVWFKGLQAVQRHRNFGLKSVFDLSATPYFLSGSGYGEGRIYPWTVSDFNLLDAIESGIVKIPRVPVDDDAATDKVVYLKLWEHIGDKLPKRVNKEYDYANATLPVELEGALRSLYRSYEKSFKTWEEHLAAFGEPPPVFIVVCSNTIVSRLVWEWIAGRPILVNEAEMYRPGKLPLLANNDADGRQMRRPRTILIDSVQIDSEGAVSKEFRSIAADEIERFKDEYRLRNPGTDVERISDEELLREVMNTVGKRGKLGEHIRCVVSVAMLTEGWDTNTVTHILGVRAFSTSLLCEQVVGRGLRRRSYAVNDKGRFSPEYAEVYGVPFEYIPTDGKMPNPTPRVPAVDVFAVDEKVDHEISFPKLQGYRIELPAAPIAWDFDDDSRWEVNNQTIATFTTLQGVLGPEEKIVMDRLKDGSVREQEVAFNIARRLARSQFAEDEEQEPWLFPQLLAATREWMRTSLVLTERTQLGYLLFSEVTNIAAEKVLRGIVRQEGNRAEVLRPIFRQFDEFGSTSDVRFQTHKPVLLPAEFYSKTHINFVVVDKAGRDGNTWEERMAQILQSSPLVHSFVKNDHLDFTIPYAFEGKSHQYVPDFIARLADSGGAPLDVFLIVEVSGARKSPGPTEAKADTTRSLWCPSVNNVGDLGLWGYLQVRDIATFQADFDIAGQALLARSMSHVGPE